MELVMRTSFPSRKTKGDLLRDQDMCAKVICQAKWLLRTSEALLLYSHRFEDEINTALLEKTKTNGKCRKAPWKLSVFLCEEVRTALCALLILHLCAAYFPMSIA